MSWLTECRGHGVPWSNEGLDGNREVAGPRRFRGDGVELATEQTRGERVPPPVVHAIAYFITPQPQTREELEQTLRSLATEIRQDAECIVCSVCLVSEGDLIIVVSGWRTREDLERHLESEQFQVLSGASRLLGASAELKVLTSAAGAVPGRP